MSQPILHDYYRSSAAYRVRIALNWKGVAYETVGTDLRRGEHRTLTFLDRNPQPGTWDRAMTWVGSTLAVGDELYLYYAGYRWGHKLNRSQDRQIGLVKLRRDRYVARHAGAATRGTRSARGSSSRP